MVQHGEKMWKTPVIHWGLLVRDSKGNYSKIKKYSHCIVIICYYIDTISILVGEWIIVIDPGHYTISHMICSIIDGICIVRPIFTSYPVLLILCYMMLYPILLLIDPLYPIISHKGRDFGDAWWHWVCHITVVNYYKLPRH